MDSPQLTLLKVDLRAQLSEISTIQEKLQVRADRLEAEDPFILESTAYQIHNFYCAVEDLLKIVAMYFENNISDSAKWHSVLLQRMASIIPQVRPAFLSTESYQLLNGLRGFRHFFRHAYGATIEYEQLKSNLDKALYLTSLLEADMHQFLAQLSAPDESTEPKI